MLCITYRTIIIRQVEQFLIAASLLELILDTDASDDSPTVKRRLNFEPEDEENENLALPEIIESCETIYPVLPTTRYLASRDQFSRSYHFLTRPDTSRLMRLLEESGVGRIMESGEDPGTHG
jgi:hypothetical protein